MPTDPTTHHTHCHPCTPARAEQFKAVSALAIGNHIFPQIFGRLWCGLLLDPLRSSKERERGWNSSLGTCVAQCSARRCVHNDSRHHAAQSSGLCTGSTDVPCSSAGRGFGRNGIQLGSDALNVGRVPVFSCTIASHALHSVPLGILSARWASASVPIAAVSPDFDSQRQPPKKKVHDEGGRTGNASVVWPPFLTTVVRSRL